MEKQTYNAEQERRITEEADAKIKNVLTDIMTARAAILEDLKRRFHEGDKTVRPNSQWDTDDGEANTSQTNYFSGAGQMPCPVCKTGTLRYSRAAYNGHVHAQCTNRSCVAWLE